MSKKASPKKAPFVCTFTFEKRFMDHGYCIKENNKIGLVVMEKSGYSTKSNASKGAKARIKKLRIPAGTIQIVL